MSDLGSVLSDMSRQRKLQLVTGFMAVIGLLMWFFNVMVYSISPGEIIAAVAIIIFAVATIHWVDDEESLEKAKKE